LHNDQLLVVAAGAIVAVTVKSGTNVFTVCIWKCGGLGVCLGVGAGVGEAVGLGVGEGVGVGVAVGDGVGVGV
jgi:hypothetical protein